jgi:acid phosphatase (class A)
MPKIFLLLGILISQISWANWEKTPSSEFPIPPPPEKDSQAYEQDFKLLKKYQETRSKKDCALAAAQEHPTFEAFFSPFEILTYDEKEKVKPLITKVMKLAERVAGYHKEKYKRPRPYDTDPSLKPCAKKPGGAKSYPSSHASSSSAATCILSLVFTDRKEKILEYGEYLGELRILSGVHHPSDVNAGRSLGKAICDTLETDEQFQIELQKLLEK